MTVTINHPRSRWPLAFGVLGIIAGLVAAGTIYYREFMNRPTDGSPVVAVEQFLTAVFESGDEAQVAALVCEGWEPRAAIKRVRAQIPSNARVGWQDVRLMNSVDERARVTATITLTPFADDDPSDLIGWTFNVVYEGSWRVCEAQRIV